MAGWLEAFAAHPLIGDAEGLKRKFGAFAELSKGEQGAAAAAASEGTLQARRAGRAERCLLLLAPLRWRDNSGTSWHSSFRRVLSSATPVPQHTMIVLLGPPARAPDASRPICRTVLPPSPPQVSAQELAEWNRRYLAKHGHIFILCASGKSAEEMLAAIKGRCVGLRRRSGPARLQAKEPVLHGRLEPRPDP